jgi:hypothetical protein
MFRRQFLKSLLVSLTLVYSDPFRLASPVEDITTDEDLVSMIYDLDPKDAPFVATATPGEYKSIWYDWQKRPLKERK